MSEPLPSDSFGDLNGDGLALPIVTFEALSLSSAMMESLAHVRYSTPTPVQATCIPLILGGIDLIIQSQTGTGKTAAFAIPIIEKLSRRARQPGEHGRVEGLVLTPTRELAQQVCAEFEQLAYRRDFETTAVYGGTSYGPQLKALKTAHVVVATPGRLLDHLRSGNLSIEHLKIFVLDEADEMLSMGFEKELDAILEFLPTGHQSILCSATVNETIKSLASHFLHNPEYVSLSSDSVAARSVEHVYFVVTGMEQTRDLSRLIEAYAPESALIFCNTRSDTAVVSKYLERQGFKVEMINGDLPQGEREKALVALKEGKVQFLVATDVAARGIDISGLPYVINYSMPDHAESYIHRTGRTGRAGMTGVALTLLTPLQIGTLYQLQRIYKLVLNERPLPSREALLELRERRHLDELVARLAKARECTRFGAYLSLSDSVLRRDDARHVVARLMAAFDELGRIRAAAERPAPVPVLAPVPPPVPVAAPAPVESSASPRQRTRNGDNDVRTRSSLGPAPARLVSRRAERPLEDEAKAVDPEEPFDEADAYAALYAAELDDDDVAGPPPDEELFEDEDFDEDEDFGDDDNLDDELDGDEDEDEDEDELYEDPAPPTTAAPRQEPSRRQGDRRGRRPAEPLREAARAEVSEVDGEPAFESIEINLGKPEFTRPGPLVRLVCKLAGLYSEDLGTVTVLDGHSEIEVRADFADDLVRALDGQRHDDVVLRPRRLR